MAFRFSLQQVLDYRIQLEDQAKIRFAKAQSEFFTAERHLRELQALLAEQEKRLYEGFLEAMERWLTEHYVRGLRDDIARTSRLLQELSRVVEEARVHLVERAKQRKILDKFREKQAIRYEHEERLREQRAYDETASIRYKAATF